ncbi:MAG TPA: hypothetical protein VI136_10015 [Verrucomicrobiae bacterium]
MSKGSIFGFLGLNDSGKSTVLLLLIGSPSCSAQEMAVASARIKWTEATLRWRRLNAETRQEICWRRIPRQVTRSMSFKREAVDQSWLQTLHRQAGPPADCAACTINLSA